MKVVEKKLTKPKVAIISLTGCEGCQFAILDLGERLFKLARYFDFRDFRLVAEHDYQVAKDHYSNVIFEAANEEFDLAIVEGTPIHQDDFMALKQIRAKSKYLIALGCCAHLGCVQQMKNYLDKKEVIKKIYAHIREVNNPEVKPLSNYVKVDFTIPACPINAEEFLRIINDLAQGRPPQIPQKPVCYECQIRGYECLLQKGLPCFGPVILGGCGAVCLESAQPCWGCRGLLQDVEVKNLKKALAKIIPHFSQKKILEVFGAREDWEEKLGKLENNERSKK